MAFYLWTLYRPVKSRDRYRNWMERPAAYMTSGYQASALGCVQLPRYGVAIVLEKCLHILSHRTEDCCMGETSRRLSTKVLELWYQQVVDVG